MHGIKKLLKTGKHSIENNIKARLASLSSDYLIQYNYYSKET